MSDERGFLKRNGFLIAGVALPVAVVIAFVLARTLPRLWVDDPRYDAVYAVHSGYGTSSRKVDAHVSVVDGRLRVRWTPTQSPVYQTPRVYRLHASTEAVDELRLPEPADVDDLAEATDVFVEGLEGFRIETNPRAPDGYEFDGSSGGGSGLLGELLVDRGRRPRGVLRKDGRRIVLPFTDDGTYGYAQVQLLGWLVPVEGPR